MMDASSGQSSISSKEKYGDVYFFLPIQSVFSWAVSAVFGYYYIFNNSLNYQM